MSNEFFPACKIDPIEQARIDRAREVALQCAAQLFSTVRSATDEHVLATASNFLPFLIGEDKPV